MINMPPSAEIIERLPHRRLEEWKWTDVRRAANDQAGLSAVLMPKITVQDGVYVSQGQGHTGDHIMAELASQVASEAWNIYAPPETRPEDPIQIEELTAGHANISMMIDKGSDITIIEHHRANSGGFVNLDMQIHLAAGARLTRIIVQDDPDNAVRVATTCLAMEAGSVLKQFTLSLGSALTRLETQVYGEGEGINALINGAYILDDARHTDLTSIVHLKHPDCLIRQSVKGVVADRSRGVFQGKFHVDRPAQQTDAEMRHDAIMLSDRAEVRSKPELEIYADDVACAHGNTIGALDENALFYMRQRGIPLAEARALLTEAFLNEVFDDLADEDLKQSILNKVRGKLETVA